ncbi:MAG: hypothetical protein HY928_16965 [Elusimicrobia bacterium]|nr:hypothetical protein [Elusimicrobiota bacterium]
MRLRLEVATNTRAPSWPFVLRLLRQWRHYELRVEDGVEVHVLEFDDEKDFVPYFEPVNSWKTYSVYRDGKLITHSAAFGIYHKVLYPNAYNPLRGEEPPTDYAERARYARRVSPLPPDELPPPAGD